MHDRFPVLDGPLSTKCALNCLSVYVACDSSNYCAYEIHPKVVHTMMNIVDIQVNSNNKNICFFVS